MRPETRSTAVVLVAGSANVDFVVRAARIPRPGETILGGDLNVVPGGKGANQAVAAARAGGVATAMLLAVGQDDLAPLLTASLEKAGVRLHLRQSQRATGAALITVSDDAENAITVAPGANGDLAAEDLPDLAGIAWIVLQLETPIATVQAYAAAARSHGVEVMLNAAPAQALPASLLSMIDLLVVNEDELSALVGDDGTIADRLSRTGVATSVVTLGGRGACAHADGAIRLQPAFAVTPIDTTAAGDTFCGTLAAGLAEGRDLPSALAGAAAAAALATTRAGAQASIPTRAEVDAFLSEPRHANASGLAAYCGIAQAQ
ncbi:ribokinase [Sphingomonas sp. BAUL-RG-20F-R05-02]|uniref:ribokinase n=1 Tax=Sphingomonas sp. BAUL-RG-20F-R05-02 TaxID=2914830 RepID=UPI00241260B9|nr:ribokinase [Sphingomonas sp. BAUL-RG-20F-R05-02]